MCVRLERRLVPLEGGGGKGVTYHWPDVGVRNSVKLLKLELVIWADVDVGSPVLGHIAVFRSRKDWRRGQSREEEWHGHESLSPVMHFPSCSSS